jgi:hypothetical protein
LRTERRLGPFELPEPNADFPIDYVLDGQQRITSIFGVFQNEIQGSSDDWKERYFDFALENDAQEPQFFALSEDEVDPQRHFPIRTVFDTTAYRRYTRELSDEIAEKIDTMQSNFKEARIPVQIFRTDEKEKVALIFERINRQGVPLDTLQLLSAWTWSEEFQLQEQFEELIADLNEFGFTDLSNDITLLLRCTAAILNFSSRPEDLVNLNGAEVRSRFDEVLNGIKGALDFIDTELSLPSIENLPYQNLLVPIAVFFAVSDNQQVILSEVQRQKLKRWFWRASFSKRYSSGVLRHMDTDIAEAAKLKRDAHSELDHISVNISDEYFLNNKFQLRSVSTKTFVAMLAQYQPKNFIGGDVVDLRNKLQKYNRKQFHHMMPRAFLVEANDSDFSDSVLANFCFISGANNREIGGNAPSKYRDKMANNIDEILLSHICPYALFDDRYDAFVKQRAQMLAQKANNLCGIYE